MRVLKYLICLFLLLACHGIQAQKYFSKTGEISFFSETPVENIEASSHSAYTVMDLESGKIQWSVLIKSFEFEKALMQEHFNENYMESSKFPKAKFKGLIENVEQLDIDAGGSFDLNVKGTLTIHGVSNEIVAQAKFDMNDAGFRGSSFFKVTVADYGIEVPSVVRQNIAEEIEISIIADYVKFER